MTKANVLKKFKHISDKLLKVKKSDRLLKYPIKSYLKY